MALFTCKYFCFIVALFAISLKLCYCHNKTHWNDAGITWYGEREGFGSSGGACGYGDAVAKPPYNCMISAGGPSIYQDGKGCGTCYEVVCHHPFCTKRPVKVMISDECPGCTKSAVHFDLSGRAFGALAKPGQGDQLRNLGELKVKYKRVFCEHPNSKIAIHIDPGANPYYMSFAVKFVNGDGNFECVEVKPAGETYIKMEAMRSAVWKLNAGRALKGPFDVRLTSAVTKTVLVAKCVIPEKWSPGAIYHSHVNFAVPKFVHKKPVHHKPIHRKPIHHHKPIHPKPIHRKPIHRKPIHRNPIHRKPIHRKPIHRKPILRKPIHHRKPIHRKPIHRKPIHHKPCHHKPPHHKPPHKTHK
ncbi:BnaC04g22130D [Brassica napus]|uniref:BnaC04g22130D protein n=1 Tax=Brassica napus TaxID=3708 RepID=A0A078IEA9_BRANA|nr:BnaC04g22130D [Brassica napus]